MTRYTRATTSQTAATRARATNTLMASNRRSHRKSRKGCTECKRRHIRCDERHPICVNCEVAERTCSFPLPKASEQQHRARHVHRPKRQPRGETNTGSSPGSDVSYDHSVEVALAEGAPSSIASVLVQDGNSSHHSQASPRLPDLAQDAQTSLVDANPSQTISSASAMQRDDVYTVLADYSPVSSSAEVSAGFTLQDMIILHHAETVPNLTGPNRSAVDIAFRYIVRAPYLLDEVLAFTAFHMASVYPTLITQLQRISTELQTRALASFTSLTERSLEDSSTTAVPRFLFSAILGRHVLAETLTYCESDFDTFIDRFVECFVLNRSIRTVTPAARSFLYQSEMQPFLDVIIEAEQKITFPGKECDALGHLMDSSDLNDSSIDSCRQAVEVLQRSFDLCRYLNEEEYPQAASVFPVRVNAGFADVLRKRRPEALAILAYFGVLLYRCRTFWAFGDAGATMIHAIVARIGSYWREVLAWPLSVLETE